MVLDPVINSTKEKKEADYRQTRQRAYWSVKEWHMEMLI